MGGRAGVVVVNYAAASLIEVNLGGLSGNDLFVVLVDNFSTPAERAALSTLAESRGWAWVPNQNRGFGDGANVGAAVAIEQGCDVIVLANPDLEIDDTRVRELVAASRARPGSIVAPQVMGTDGLPWGRLGQIDVGGRGQPDDRGSTPSWVSGACLALTSETWVGLGGFSEDYFMYWEDVDLCLRCQRSGGSIVLIDEIHVTHSVGGTQGEGRSRLYYYYNCRNRLVFAAKNLTAGQQFAWLLATPSDVRKVVRRDQAIQRWQRATKALPPSLHGVAAGAAWMLVFAVRAAMRRS